MENVKRKAGRPSKSHIGDVSSMNKTLIRSMQILERLAQSNSGLTLSELSQQLGIATATVFRLLYTFEELGYVTQNKQFGLWSIGVKTYTVGTAFLNHRDVVSLARSYMVALMEFSGETVNLSIVDNGKVVFISQVESFEMMRMIVHLGSSAPIHASGAGKALLATMTSSQVSKILLKRGLDRITENTINSADKLKLELKTTQSRGYAIDDEEHAIGLRCVASPIYNEFGGASMAISISGPKVRISDQRLNILGSKVAEIATQITQVSGGLLPP